MASMTSLRGGCALWLGVCVLSTLAVGCGDSDSSASTDGGVDGGSKLPDGGTPDGGDPDGGAPSALLVGPAASQVASLELDEPVTDVIYAEDLALGLHEESDVSILDMSDPTDPKVFARLPTSGRAIAAVLDPSRRLLFIVTISGDLRVYRVADVTAPAMAAQTTVSEPGASDDSTQGMVRVLDRLFLLGAARLLPVQVQFGNAGSIGLLAEADIELDTDPERIETSGGELFIGFAGGKVQIWSAGGSPSMRDEADLGADIIDWIVRGRRIFAALSGLGLRVVDLGDAGNAQMLFDAPDLDDIAGLKRFGNLVLASLSRDMLVALDLSDFSAPRSLVTRSGTLPRWIAPIGGNLLLGTGRNLSVFGVPPFVSATVPRISADAFPRYGRIPLQLSKAVDPGTVSNDTVTLRCGGDAVGGEVVVSVDSRLITFLPNATLPAGVDCGLELDGVKDDLGLDLSAGGGMMSFTTAMQAPEPVENPQSAYEHTADGEFTDWTDDSDEFEYFDVTAARGMYSHFYADYDGERLWLLNDWFYNGDDIDPDCYNQFGVWTGDGAQRWDIRAYGDQRIEVRLNGTLLEEGDARVTGGYSRTATPNDSEPHTVYEISIETEPGNWGVQLHDPGPTFSCHRLETDPTNYVGASTMEDSMVDATQAPTMPDTPVLSRGQVTTETTTLSWTSEGQGGDVRAFVAYLFELSTGDDLSNVIFRQVVYGPSLTLPEGLLQDGMTYTWRVTAYNLAGRVRSETTTFTVGGEQNVEAPTLSAVQPNSIEQGSMATLFLVGSGFAEGARAYFDGTEVGTTYESGTSLVAMVPASLTESAGVFNLYVRNDPSDDATQSETIEVTVTEAQSGGTVALVSINPSEITAGQFVNIDVTLDNGVADTYYLVLTPSGGGNALEPVFCDWTQMDHCGASVNVAEGTYDVHVQVGSGQGMYDTNTLTGALVAGAGQQGGGMCLADAQQLMGVTGSGTCADAYRIDLSAQQLGSRWYFEVPDTFSNDQTDQSIGANDESGLCAAGTQRDVVFAIRFPSGTYLGSFGAEGPGVNAIVSVSADNACGQIPLMRCLNIVDADSCEALTLTYPDSTEFYFVVSEATNSGQPIIVSLTSS